MIMIKQIFILTVLSLSSICVAAQETRSSNARPIPTIIVLPDAFSEGDQLKLAPSEVSDQQSVDHENEWQLIRNQTVENYQTAGIAAATTFNDLFSVATYGFADVIYLRTPRVETILERHVLAARYIARLNALAQRLPQRFSNVVLAGIGRGADIAQAMIDQKDDSANEFLKNVSGVVSVGDRRKLVELLDIVQDNSQAPGEQPQTPRVNLARALTVLDSSVRTLNKGLGNLQQQTKTDKKLDRKRVSKIYTYYMLTLLGFMEELAKLQSSHATQTAIKMATLTSDIMKDPEFKGKLLSFMQIWMTNPDEKMALFLINELTNPMIAKKVSDLSEIFSEGKTYKELPLVSRIYFHALKQAVSQNGFQLTQSLSASTNSQDPSAFLNNLNKRIMELGAAITEIKKGLVDMGVTPDSKQQANIFHLEFTENNQTLDKDLFLKVLNLASGSTASEVRSGL